MYAIILNKKGFFMSQEQKQCLCFEYGMFMSMRNAVMTYYYS